MLCIIQRNSAWIGRKKYVAFVFLIDNSSVTRLCLSHASIGSVPWFDRMKPWKPWGKSLTKERKRNSWLRIEDRQHATGILHRVCPLDVSRSNFSFVANQLSRVTGEENTRGTKRSTWHIKERVMILPLLFFIVFFLVFKPKMSNSASQSEEFYTGKPCHHVPPGVPFIIKLS